MDPEQGIWVVMTLFSILLGHSGGQLQNLMALRLW